MLMQGSVVESHWERHVVLVVGEREHQGTHRLHRSGHGHESGGVHAGGYREGLGGGRWHEVDRRGLHLASKGGRVVGVHVQGIVLRHAEGLRLRMCVVLQRVVPVACHEGAALELQASRRKVAMIAVRPAVVLLWSMRRLVLLTRA